MKTSFLDGRSLAQELPRLIECCDGVDIAMAYVKLGGLNTLLKRADSLIEKKDSVRIVFGLAERYGITDGLIPHQRPGRHRPVHQAL